MSAKAVFIDRLGNQTERSFLDYIAKLAERPQVLSYFLRCNDENSEEITQARLIIEDK